MKQTTLMDCFYCDGFNFQCLKFTPLDNDVCLWYSYVDRHLNELIYDYVRGRSK